MPFDSELRLVILKRTRFGRFQKDYHPGALRILVSVQAPLDGAC